MRKRILSVVLVLALLGTFIGVKIANKDVSVVYAEEYRNGYAIIPSEGDGTGVSVDTTFLFKDEDQGVTIDELTNGLIISPHSEFTVEVVEDGFLIRLGSELKKDSIVTFTYDNTTFSFQTMKQFNILGVLPSNESTSVPINTGIEMYFSHYGAEVEDYFEISPSVKGSFEVHDKVVVFVPKELEEKTIYTVTLKAGLPLDDSEQTLLEDYSFSFETGEKEDSEYEPWSYFSFNKNIYEFEDDETQRLALSYYVEDMAKDATIETNIYAYASIDDFTKALEAYVQTPSWSYYASENYVIESKGLEKVMSFNEAIVEEDYQSFIALPNSLEKGYYLVDCHYEDVVFQTFIQVTDISYYYLDATNGSLFWLNNLETGEPIVGATIINQDANDEYISNDQGVVVVNQDIEDDHYYDIYRITSGEDSAVLLYFEGYNYETSDLYWRYFQTDRTLYEPDDTISFWGFIQNRYADETVEEITVEISQNNWWWYYSYLPFQSNSLAFETVAVPVEDGFYSGDIEIPNLEKGSYQVNVKLGDTTISTTYIDVDNYVKPAYQLGITKDKEAIFEGEDVNVSFNTMFYDGTKVANLDVSYEIYGDNYLSGVLTTDLSGEATLNYTNAMGYQEQGIGYEWISAYATLPESGQIWTEDSLRVFINDINVAVETSLEGEDGEVVVQVNDITLDRLNDGTAEDDNDYLSDPVINHEITATIYRNEWIKTEVGEHYDFINKVVRKDYDYNLETTFYDEATFYTDETGEAKLAVSLPEEEDVYYSVKIKTLDHEQKKMTFENHFYKRYNYKSSYDWYELIAEQYRYSVGEEMAITFANNEAAVEEASFLFITAQNGIKDYEWVDSPTYYHEFDETMIPNVNIYGVCFNGKTYIEASNLSASLNQEDMTIEFSAITDKTEYMPGETCTVNLKATMDVEGSEVAVPVSDVVVNASIIDEALLSLSENNIDVLNELYRSVDDGINYSYISHYNMNYDQRMYYGGMGITEDSSEEMVMEGGMWPMEMDSNASIKGMDEVYVRSDFKDTAYFETINLDENGEGTFTFTLPDNITSWRMTFAGISKSLMAGTNTEELVVTLPYFMNTSLNQTYLTGDQPSIGVSAYGDSLTEEETISYEVSCEELGYKVTAEGKAFERVNIPLWKMEKGDYTVTIKSISETGLSDGLETTIQVVDTYYTIEMADYYEVAEGLTLTATDAGLTKLTFVDQGKGKFMPALYSLAYGNGKRVDQKYLADIARDILANEFDVETYFDEAVSLSDYQKDDGSISILPYADADLETTVKMLPLIKDLVNTEKIKMYLYNELDNSESVSKAMAVYGLAILDEPVLMECEALRTVKNLSFEDTIYLAMAFAEVGDVYVGNMIYEESIAEYTSVYENTAVVEHGDDENEFLADTALVMNLASRLNLEEKDLFFDYVRRHYSKEVLVNAEKLAYIISEIDSRNEEEAVINYSYNDVTYEVALNDGWPETITVPSAKLDTFVINSVSGEVALVAVYQDEPTTMYDLDKDVSVTRAYQVYGTDDRTNAFEQTDIVKVVIDYEIDKNAIDDYYVITDYVPSGLVPIENVWQMGLEDSGYYYRDIEGQKVSFYVYKDNEHYQQLYYYARVVSAGEYIGEGTIIQGSEIKESINVGDRDTIIIE
jgi:hypothetical protein